MAETEPTPWELMRMLRQVDGKLDQVVTKDMFQAESRRVDDRLNDVAKDITDERIEREKAITTERAAREAAMAFEKVEREKALKSESDKRAAIQAATDRYGARMMWLIGAALLPTVFFIINLLTSRGGA
jgi:hypothetical protein